MATTMRNEDVQIYDDNDYDDSFSAALAEQWGGAPWYLSSIAIHSVAFIVLMLIPTPQEQPKHNLVIQTEIITPLDDIEDPPPPPTKDPVPVEEKFDDVDQPNPAPININIEFTPSDHNESDENENNNEMKGELTNVDLVNNDINALVPMGVGNLGIPGGGAKFGNGRIGSNKNYLIGKNSGTGTQHSVKLALKWLAAHQEPDGRWDCAKYGGGKHDYAVTGLALLAFLGDGNSTTFGKHHKTVNKAVYWLLTNQDEKTGRIGPHRYEAGITTMAIAEAYGMNKDSSLRKKAQAAVDWAVKSQCPSGGWDYAATNAARVDTSVTGWWIMGLKSAKSVGLRVPYTTMEKALKYIQQATGDPKGGDDYGYGGTCSISYSSQAADVNNVTKGGNNPRLTPVSLTCLQFLGRPRTDAQVIGTANKTIGDGDCINSKYDFYRWYYATLGLFQMGGENKEYWEKWNKPMKKRLVSTQIRVGTVQENRGSWNYDTDNHGARWGRVGQTALGALMLEVYYRYDILSDKAKKHSKKK